LANNHVLDWGSAGLIETLEALARAGIRVAGAGRDLEAASAPAAPEVGNGNRVLVFAFGSTDSGIPDDWAAGAGRAGVHLLPDLSRKAVEYVARVVSATKRPRDIAVASIHWGPNWGFDVPAAHRSFAHGLIDRASIDVVHGHSSHHVKAIEIYRGRPILYGCGDFLDDYEGIAGYEAFRSDLALAYFVDVESGGALSSLDLRPLRIRRFRLEAASAADLEWLRATLDREGAVLGSAVRRFGPGRLALEWTLGGRSAASFAGQDVAPT
jgi:poly-gamma-glutamate synthesis protein (capsule biosynthesis protein)